MLTRRHFVVTFAGSLAGAALLPACAGAAEAAAPPAKPLPLAAPTPGLPTARVTGPDAVAIVWGVRGLCTGLVEYGPTEALGQTARGAELGLCPLATDVLRIPLTGLTPGAKVFYRTVTAPVAFPNHYAIRRGEGVASPVHSFTVPAASAKEARLAVWNDLHGQSKTLAALRTATGKFAPDLLALNGDLVRDQYASADDLADTFLGEDKGVACARWPALFVRGNHDARGLLARELPRFVPASLDGGLGGGYHVLLRLGPLAVLTLDTGEDKEGPGTYGGMGAFADARQKQAAWLESAIADERFTSASFRLLLCHIPLRWKSPRAEGAWSRDGDALWSPLLAKGKVQAVVSGHTHSFWHDAPTQARPFHQITAGGPETARTGWSPTPATLTEITATADRLRIRVAEAASGKEHLDLAFDPVAA